MLKNSILLLNFLLSQNGRRGIPAANFEFFDGNFSTRRKNSDSFFSITQKFRGRRQLSSSLLRRS